MNWILLQIFFFYPYSSMWGRRNMFTFPFRPTYAIFVLAPFYRIYPLMQSTQVFLERPPTNISAIESSQYLKTFQTLLVLEWFWCKVHTAQHFCYIFIQYGLLSIISASVIVNKMHRYVSSRNGTETPQMCLLWSPNEFSTPDL